MREEALALPVLSVNQPQLSEIDLFLLMRKHGYGLIGRFTIDQCLFETRAIPSASQSDSPSNDAA